MSDEETDSLGSENQGGGEAQQLSHPRLVVQKPGQRHQEHRSRATGNFLTMTREHSGPLPTAEYLRAIKEIIPDGPERILAMAEKNADHRHRMEEKELESVVEYNRGLLTRSNRGLAAGFVVALALGTAAWNLISNGHEVSGSILGSLDIVGLVSVFVIGRATSGKPPKTGETSKEEDQEEDSSLPSSRK